MFGISTTELLIILAVGLIVLGPQKLPELARALGKAIGEFRKATTEIKETFEADENIAAVKKTFDEALAEGMKQGFSKETVEEALTSGLAESMATSAAKEMEEDKKTAEHDWNHPPEDQEEYDFSKAADFTGEMIPADPPPDQQTEETAQPAAEEPERDPSGDLKDETEPDGAPAPEAKPAQTTDPAQDGEHKTEKA